MNTQTQRVDVLAVMRAVAEFGVSAPEWHDMTKAAAAVADLIGATGELIEHVEPVLRDYGFVYFGKLEKAKRTIARVSGGAK